MKRRNKKNLGFLLVIIASLCYGTMPAVTQKCYQLGMTVDTTLATRYIFGTLLIWIWIFAVKRERKIDRRELGFLLILGLVIFLCTYCMSASYQYLPGAIASILVFLYIVYVNIIEILMGREKLYKSRLLCLILVVGGIILIIYTPEDVGSLSHHGLILAFIAGVLYSIMSMGMGAKRISRISAEVVMGYVMIVPSIALITKCLMSGNPVLPWIPEQWFWVGLLAIGPGFLASVCFCAAVKIIGASTASMINTSEPVVAYFAGIIIMAEKIAPVATFGGIIIVIAIFILNVTEKRREMRLSSYPDA